MKATTCAGTNSNNTPDEVSMITFGTGFKGGITDIETGPDGYLYVLSYDGKLYRIVPNNQ